MPGELIVPIEPGRLAIEYYFGDLQYWKLPRIAADALEQGFDGPALRRLAGITNPVEAEMDPKQIDCAFREMGVDAPVSRDQARLVLAAHSISEALNGLSNVFDAATHIRIHLCEFDAPPAELLGIFNLAKEVEHAPRKRWESLESELCEAFSEFLKNHKLD